jgi:hypothetical protein
VSVLIDIVEGMSADPRRSEKFRRIVLSPVRAKTTAWRIVADRPVSGPKTSKKKANMTSVMARSSRMACATKDGIQTKSYRQMSRGRSHQPVGG